MEGVAILELGRWLLTHADSCFLGLNVGGSVASCDSGFRGCVFVMGVCYSEMMFSVGLDGLSWILGSGLCES